MREICTSGSTRGEWVALTASPSLLLYRLRVGRIGTPGFASTRGTGLPGGEGFFEHLGKIVRASGAGADLHYALLGERAVDQGLDVLAAIADGAEAVGEAEALHVAGDFVGEDVG